MKKVYLVSFFLEGAEHPETFVFGGRNMAQRFVRQMIDDHGIDGKRIKVKQYTVVTEDQLTGHYGEKNEN